MKDDARAAGVVIARNDQHAPYLKAVYFGGEQLGFIDRGVGVVRKGPKQTLRVPSFYQESSSHLSFGMRNALNEVVRATD